MHKWLQRILGILALGGGFAGLALGLGLLTTAGPWFAQFLVALFLVISAWGVLSGLWLLEGRPNAYRQNFYFWLLQVPYVLSNAGIYFVACGASWFLTWQPQVPQWDYFPSFGAHFLFAIAPQHAQPLTLGVNVFATAICAYFWWLQRQRSRPNDAGAQAVASH